MWNPFERLWPRPAAREEAWQEARDRVLKQAPIPVLWLFGKTGSGKSSIVRFLTGAESIDIGTGYRPQTRFSSRYDFPDEGQPLMRFLDTRGLGEVSYDPREDLDAFGDSAQLMIVVVRAMDHALDEVLAPLREIRKAAPHRPVILALTALHDAYPGEQHADPDPFGSGPFPLPSNIPDGLKRSIELQYQRFRGLFDRAVPLDITPEWEGFSNPALGGDRLKFAIIESLPAAYRQTLIQLDDASRTLEGVARRRALPYILSASTLAATASAIPVPWVDIPLVMGLQSHLIYKLARIYNQPIDAQTIAQVSGSIGGRVAVRMALRETLKFIPWVGMAANAAASFAYTFAIGMAWNWYFTRLKAGHVPTETEMRSFFKDQLAQAAALWKSTHADPPPPSP